MKLYAVALIVVGSLAVSTPSHAQGPPPAELRSLIRPSLSSRPTGTAYKLPSTVLIKNRARVLADDTTASGKRYFAVDDQQIAGKSPSEILHLLQPAPVQSGDGVRSVYVLIDLTRGKASTLVGERGEPVDVGTVRADGRSLRSLDVQSIIRAPGLTVVAR